MNKKIKVIHVIPTLNFGGIETHRFLIAKYHNPQKYELLFCCLSKAGTVSKKIEELGYDILFLNENVKIPNLKLILKLYTLFRKEKPDVVHSCASEANFHAMIAAFMARIPVRIAEEIGLPSQSKKAKIVFRLIYMISSKVIGVSQKVSDYLLMENKVPKDKVRTIYNPYDIDLYKNINSSENKQKDKFIIVSVGRLVHEKNHIYLIKAVEEIIKKFPKIQLNIVGAGPLNSELQAYINLNNLNMNIQLLGFREDIPQILQNCDLFILPSKLEGLGIALIEAMASGTLVIATDTGGIPEVISKNPITGWIVPNDDVDYLVNTIEHVMRLPEEEKNTIIDTAQKSVEEKFSPYAYLENIYNLYTNLLRNKL